jgi:hypothetical protein
MGCEVLQAVKAAQITIPRQYMSPPLLRPVFNARMNSTCYEDRTFSETIAYWRPDSLC